MEGAPPDADFFDVRLWLGFVYFAAIGAAMGGSIQATSLGHRVLGLSILMILVGAIVLALALLSQLD